MSRPAEEPRPPKRPRPSLTDKTHPAIDDDEGPSTFRPNPARLGGKPLIDESRLDEILPGRAAGPESTRAGKARGTSMKEPAPVTGGPSWIERILFGRVSTGHLAVFSRELP
jgi:hypothetical protein